MRNHGWDSMPSRCGYRRKRKLKKTNLRSQCILEFILFSYIAVLCVFLIRFVFFAKQRHGLNDKRKSSMTITSDAPHTQIITLHHSEAVTWQPPGGALVFAYVIVGRAAVKKKTTTLLLMQCYGNDDWFWSVILVEWYIYMIRMWIMQDILFSFLAWLRNWKSIYHRHASTPEQSARILYLLEQQ